jgi:hypothetical protein
MTLRCQYWTRYVYNNHIEFGKEFASALEITRNAYYLEGKPSDEAIALGLDNILNTFGVTFQPSNIATDLKTPAKMQEVFARYFEEFPLDTDIKPFVLPNGRLSVEQRYDIELPFLHPELGVPLILSAKPDLLGVDNNGNTVLIDEKTAGQSGLSDVIKTTDKYRTRNQFVQYTTLLNKFVELPVAPVSQAKIRRVVLTKSKLVSNKKVGGNIIPTTSQVVEEYSFNIDRWYQSEWWETTLLTIEEMLDSYKRHMEGGQRAFLRKYGNCEQFFNPCELTNHCTSGAAQDLSSLGYKQIWRDKDTGESMLMHNKRILLGLDEGELITESKEQTTEELMEELGINDTFIEEL